MIYTTWACFNSLLTYLYRTEVNENQWMTMICSKQATTCRGYLTAKCFSSCSSLKKRIECVAQNQHLHVNSLKHPSHILRSSRSGVELRSGQCVAWEFAKVCWAHFFHSTAVWPWLNPRGPEGLRRSGEWVLLNLGQPLGMRGQGSLRLTLSRQVTFGGWLWVEDTSETKVVNPDRFEDAFKERWGQKRLTTNNFKWMYLEKAVNVHNCLQQCQVYRFTSIPPPMAFLQFLYLLPFPVTTDLMIYKTKHVEAHWW